MDRFQSNVTPIRQGVTPKQPKPEIVLADLDAEDKAQGLAYLRARGIPEEIAKDACVFGRWGFSKQEVSLPLDSRIEKAARSLRLNGVAPMKTSTSVSRQSALASGILIRPMAVSRSLSAKARLMR